MEYNAENLEKAVSLFYQSNSGQQAEAHEWLNNAQISPQAWSFVWDLLELNKPPEVQFFAAASLHTKILKYWNEVPEVHYGLLKDRLLENILKFANGPKIVLNRLCIGLSAYVMHTIQNYWTNAIPDLVTSFQPQYLPAVDPDRITWILLEILTVIPAEFQNMNIPQAQRLDIRNSLRNFTLDILKICESYMEPGSDYRYDKKKINTYFNATKCAVAWIQLGPVTVENCNQLIELLIKVTKVTYWSKDCDGLSCEEVELIETTTDALSSILNVPNADKYPNTVLNSIGNILQSFKSIIDSECSEQDYSKDIVCSIFGLIVAVADTHSKLLLDCLLSTNNTEKDIALYTIQAILSCTNLSGSYPVDENSSLITFAFWYGLQDEAFHVHADKRLPLLNILKPYYRELVNIMLRKSTFPSSDEDPNWTAVDKELFRCYRQDISDTLLYCYNVLELELLELLYNRLCSALSICICDSGEVIYDNWPHIEACLHAFIAVSACVEMDETHLPQLMEILRNMPYQHLHIKVLASAIDTIGHYSEWLNEHPITLSKVINLLTDGLKNPNVAANATLALKDMSMTCQNELQPYADHILQTCQIAMQSGQLGLTECVRIMYAMGKILSAMPSETVLKYLNIILTPYFKEIESLLAKDDHNKSDETLLVTRLKIFASLFDSLRIGKGNGQQPLFIIMQTTLPLYTAIVRKWYENQEIMEIFCKLFQNVITSLMDDVKPLTGEIIQIIITCFRETQQPAIIKVANQLVVLFGKDENMKELIETLVIEIIDVTLQKYSELSENGPNGLAEQAELFSQFFQMLYEIFKKNPDYLINPKVDLSVLFQCATVALTVQEQSVIKYSGLFLVTLINQSREFYLSNLVQHYGEQLVVTILLGLGGNVMRYAFTTYNDILYILYKKYCDNLSRWLNQILLPDDFLSTNLSKVEKENFIDRILRENNKRVRAEVVQKFALLCRGIINKEMRL